MIGYGTVAGLVNILVFSKLIPRFFGNYVLLWDYSAVLLECLSILFSQ